MERRTTASGAEIIICSSLEELAREGAASIAGLLGAKGLEGVSVALSGGSTPRPVYELLASEYRDVIPWEHVKIFWGDERYVPHDSPQSNYRMAREAMLGRLPLPARNIHPIPTDASSAEEASRAYEETLRRELGARSPALDLLLLGLGDDGHTASLFPGSPALPEHARLTAVAQAPAEPRIRITLTFPMLARAERIIFLVAGRAKHRPLRAILDDPATARDHYPAAMIPQSEKTLWIVDREAYEG